VAICAAGHVNYPVALVCGSAENLSPLTFSCYHPDRLITAIWGFGDTIFQSGWLATSLGFQKA
jgi:hypothetical protein